MRYSGKKLPFAALCLLRIVLFHLQKVPFPRIFIFFSDFLNADFINLNADRVGKEMSNLIAANTARPKTKNKKKKKNVYPFLYPLYLLIMPMQRQRKKVSCVPCHNKKRKCDRKMPCQACIRGKRNCFYESISEKNKSTVTKSYNKGPQPCGILTMGNNGWSRYVSSTFWALLRNQDDNSKDYLKLLSDYSKQKENDNNITDPQKPTFSLFFDNPPGPIYSSKEVIYSIIPPQAHGLFLLDRYTTAVHPFIPFCDIQELRQEYLDGFEKANFAYLSLFFAVCYSACCSLKLETTPIFIPSNKDSIRQIYFSALENSLREAGFPHNCSLHSLQACVISQLCNLQEHSVHSPLTPTLVRMAQTMGLHRDGEYYDLDRHTTNKRRLTWWMVVFLDIQDAICRDLTCSIREDEYDTKLPDIESVPSIIANVTAQSCIAYNKVIRSLYGLKHDGTIPRILQRVNEMLDEHDATCVQLKTLLSEHSEEKLVQYTFNSMVGIPAKLRLLLAPYYHYQLGNTAKPIIDSCVENITALVEMYSNSDFTQYLWFTSIFQPFHAVMLLLSYIYKHPDNTDRDYYISIIASAFKYIQPYGGTNWSILSQMKDDILGSAVDEIDWNGWESVFESFPEMREYFFTGEDEVYPTIA